jgi:hypothetical protein
MFARHRRRRSTRLARSSATMSRGMQTEAYDEKKFTELVVYVASKLEDDPEGGAVKLNKTLWWAETAHVRMHGRSISGARYQKLPQGPAPRRLLPVRDALVETGEAELQQRWYRGYRQDRLIPRRPADLSVLTTDEVEIVDQVLGATRGKTATELSAMSHDEMGWKMVDIGEDIPFSSAYLADDVVVTPAIRERARAFAARRRA